MAYPKISPTKTAFYESFLDIRLALVGFIMVLFFELLDIVFPDWKIIFFVFFWKGAKLQKKKRKKFKKRNRIGRKLTKGKRDENKKLEKIENGRGCCQSTAQPRKEIEKIENGRGWSKDDWNGDDNFNLGEQIINFISL